MQNMTVSTIQSKIISLPNRPPAMLAQDVAEIYETETRRVNEAVSRNPERFPEDFCFQATAIEIELIRSQSATKIYGGEQIRPWLFTHYGCNQLSAVLSSPVAVDRSVQIMRAFTAVEQAALSGSPLRDVLGDELYSKFFGHAPSHSQAGPAINAMTEQIIQMVVPAVVSQVMQQVTGRMQTLDGQLAEMETGKLLYPLETSHVVAFVKDSCSLDVQGWTAKRVLFLQYTRWCEGHGEVPYDYSNFLKALYQTGLPLRKAEKRSRRGGIIIKIVRGIEVAATEAKLAGALATTLGMDKRS